MSADVILNCYICNHFEFSPTSRSDRTGHGIEQVTDYDDLSIALLVFPLLYLANLSLLINCFEHIT
jgi:hypothetical protein